MAVRFTTLFLLLIGLTATVAPAEPVESASTFYSESSRTLIILRNRNEPERYNMILIKYAKDNFPESIVISKNARLTGKICAWDSGTEVVFEAGSFEAKNLKENSHGESTVMSESPDETLKGRLRRLPRFLLFTPKAFQCDQHLMLIEFKPSMDKINLLAAEYIDWKGGEDLSRARMTNCMFMMDGTHAIATAESFDFRQLNL